MFKKLLSSLLLVSSCALISAQDESAINILNQATINTLLVFTSQEGLNSGVYHFTNTPSDVEMTIYHLPFIYNFKSTTNINYFVVGNVGYSRVALSGEYQAKSDLVLDYFNHLQTYTAGLGGGVRYKIKSDLFISGGGELIYSRAGVSVKKPDGDLGNVIEDFFNENYSNNLTYKFFTLAEYRPLIAEFKPYVTLNYKLYETKSSYSVNDLVEFDSESSVTSISLGVETPKLIEFNKYNNITLEAYLTGNYVTGTVKEVVDFSTYGTVGGIVYLNTLAQPWWASRFYLELNSVQADGLNGYNVGVGFTIDF